MRFKSIGLLFISILISVQAFSYVTEPPAGFRSFNWGSSPSANLRLIAGPTSDGTAMYVPPPGKSLAPFLEVPVAEESYTFSYGKFFSGSVWIDGKGNFEKVKAALFKLYDKPDFANEGINLWKWKWQGNQIEVHLSYQAKFSRAEIKYVNNAI